MWLPGLTLAYCGDNILEEPKEQCDDGNFFDRDGCSSYCEIEDMEPPTLASADPADGANGVPTDRAELRLIFSEAMSPASINTSNIHLKQGGTSRAIQLTLQPDRKTVLLKPNEPMVPEARHSIYIKGVADAAGTIVLEPIIVLFHTAKAVDKTPPHVVLTPAPGFYTIAQSVTLQAYRTPDAPFKHNIDETARIYYTLDGSTPNRGSPMYQEDFSVREDTTITYFAEDTEGNRTPVMTARYTFDCPELTGAKTHTPYPECRILQCNFGTVLLGNVCVARMGGEDDSLRFSAVLAPSFPSATPLTISTKPAIRLTEDHGGVIQRPLLFKEPKQGTVVRFFSGTLITTPDGKPFSGYITVPKTMYSKDFKIHFGYTFKSIFSFFPSDEQELRFDPAYQIILPVTDLFRIGDPVTVFTLDRVTGQYREVSSDHVVTDFKAGEVRITADRSNVFFVAQSATGFNQVEFLDTVGHWTQPYAELLFRKDIVKGRSKGVYAPDEFLNRAEFTKIALKSIDAAIPNEDDLTDSPFPDVPLNAWYTPYVAKARELDLIKGYPDGKFRPEKPINRAEAIKILISAFRFTVDDSTAEMDATGATAYPDVLKDQWYYPYVNLVIKNDLLGAIRDGRTYAPGNLFGPGRNISRGEMAKLAIETISLAEKLGRNR